MRGRHRRHRRGDCAGERCRLARRSATTKGRRRPQPRAAGGKGVAHVSRRGNERAGAGCRLLGEGGGAGAREDEAGQAIHVCCGGTVSLFRRSDRRLSCFAGEDEAGRAIHFCRGGAVSPFRRSDQRACLAFCVSSGAFGAMSSPSSRSVCFWTFVRYCICSSGFVHC